MEIRLKKLVKNTPFPLFALILIFFAMALARIKNPLSYIKISTTMFLLFLALVAVFGTKAERVKYKESRKYYLAIIEPMIMLTIMVLSGSVLNIENYRTIEPFDTLNEIFFAVILAPFLEEFVFRGLIINKVRNHTNKFIAVAVASMMFALVHTQYGKPMQWNILLMAVLYAIFYLKTGNILIPIINHALHNLIVVLIKYGYFKVDSIYFVLIIFVIIFTILLLLYLKVFSKGISRKEFFEQKTTEEKIQEERKRKSVEKQYFIENNEVKERIKEHFEDQRDIPDEKEKQRLKIYRLKKLINFSLAFITMAFLIYPLVRPVKFSNSIYTFIMMTKDGGRTVLLPRDADGESMAVTEYLDNLELETYDSFYDSRSQIRVTLYADEGSFKTITVNPANLIVQGTNVYRDANKSDIYKQLDKIYKEKIDSPMTFYLQYMTSFGLSQNSNIVMRNEKAHQCDVRNIEDIKNIKGWLSGKVLSPVKSMNLDEFILLSSLMREGERNVVAKYTINKMGSLELDFDGHKIGPYIIKDGEKIYKNIREIFEKTYKN